MFPRGDVGITLWRNWLSTDFLHCGLCAAGFCVGAWDRLRSPIFRMCFLVRCGEPLRYGAICPNVVQSTCHMRGISSVGPDGSGPCGWGNSVLWRNFRGRMCTCIPRCSFWYECGFHGYVLVVSPACCEVSPMLLDVHILWRHNCRLLRRSVVRETDQLPYELGGRGIYQVSAMMSLPFVFLCSSVFDQNHVRFRKLTRS